MNIPEDYRALVVREVKADETNISFSFRDSEIIFHFDKKTAQSYRIGKSKKGDLLLIKGKKGNKDTDLSSIEDIENICFAKSDVIEIIATKKGNEWHACPIHNPIIATTSTRDYYDAVGRLAVKMGLFKIKMGI